ENLPTAIRVPARRITYMSGVNALTGGLRKGNSNVVSSNKLNFNKEFCNNKPIKLIQETRIKAPTTIIPLRKSTLANFSKVNTAPKSRTRAIAHKDTQVKFKSNPASNVVSSSKLKSVSNKPTKPIQETRIKAPTTTVPLRKPTIASLSKVNTAPKSRTRATAHKDTQVKFKSNPASLEEILSSKTANDADKKRSQTLIGRGLRPKSTVGTANRINRMTDLSRSRMTYSYRVKKPCDSKTSGALRVPRIPTKVSSSTRPLSTARESLLMTPARRYPSSITRRITTSYVNKGVSVLGNIKANRLTMISNLGQKNPEITPDSLLEPMRNLKLRRLSRKPITIDDLKPSIDTPSKLDEVLELAASIPLPPSPVSEHEALVNVDKQQKCEGDKEPPNGSHLPTVEEFRLFEELEKLEKQLEQEISEVVTPANN
ncbi:31765_t:CDS:2, partial [Gigaspora margarita]